MPKNKPSLISIHQMVVKVSFLSEKSAHDGRFSVYFSLKQLLHKKKLICEKILLARS